MQFAGLDLIVGEGAAMAAPDFQTELAEFPNLKARLDAMIYVNNSRWDLLLSEHQTRVQLPGQGRQAALSRLVELQASTQILDREIAVIDMRVDGRLTLTPSAPEKSVNLSLQKPKKDRA